MNSSGLAGTWLLAFAKQSDGDRRVFAGSVPPDISMLGNHCTSSLNPVKGIPRRPATDEKVRRLSLRC